MIARLILILAAFSQLVSAESKPNIVLFVVDDLGWRDLGCQGSDFYQTPHIDALAASGVRFTDAYAACAVCSPTRAALLTGKYPARLMLTQWLPAGRWSPEKNRKREGRFLRALPLEEFTLAETLREAGYATWHVGKWHLGGPPFSLPEQHGFDINIAGSEHGAPGHYFYPFKGKWTVPTTGTPVLKQTLPDGTEGDYLTDRLAEAAADLIRKNRDKPFFLHLPFYSVHTPLQAKKEKIERYKAISEDQRQGHPTYAAMVEHVDDAVGKIMATLTELNLEDNTLVIFTSDNGGFARATDNSPLRANKGSHYEGGIRVPLIVKGPGIQRGEVTDQLAHSNDLYPTILDLAELPKRPHQHVDGVSLGETLKNGSQLKRETLFWHYPHYNQHPQSNPVSIIRRGNWKLIEFLETGQLELYDLATDLGEAKNLTQTEPELARELQAELNNWREQVGADPMLPNPLYQTP